MGRVTREIDGVKYTYLRTYYDSEEADRRRQQIEAHGRKTMAASRYLQHRGDTAYDVMANLGLADRIYLGFLDMFVEVMYPPWRVPFAQQPRVDEMILR